MKKPIATFYLMILLCSSCNNNPRQMAGVQTSKDNAAECTDDCMAKSKSGAMACKLTTPELQQRKATVIASLKQQMVDRKELSNGYAFKFAGTDQVVDELTEFIKTERECCDFFNFNLSVSGDKSEAWLQLTGAEGAKEFITAELGM
jgi:hypothetical protein